MTWLKNFVSGDIGGDDNKHIEDNLDAAIESEDGTNDNGGSDDEQS